MLLCLSCLTGCGSREDGTIDVNQEREAPEGNITEAVNGDRGKIDPQAAGMIEPGSGEDAGPEQLNVSIDITEHYITHKGDPSNLYHIDEDNVLWGCGSNKYGQLGQGTQDDGFHGDMVKIAENVVHVDYSQRGFTIFLTEDHKLYGMGNAARGAVKPYMNVDWSQPANWEHNTVTTPALLMGDVVYACCGRDDIVCMKEDGTVWTWGSVYPGYSITSPTKFFEKAVLVTGGWFNHAALLPNGMLWTWGYNNAGNCGVAGTGLVSKPTLAAEDVVMAWTDISIDGYPQPDADDIALAWTGKLKYTQYDSIEGYVEYGFYPFSLNNTVIQKSDGSYWVCGENVGTEEKTVSGEEAGYRVICTHEFYPCD